MKISLFVLASVCAMALSVPTMKDGKYMETDKNMLERQKQILTLFYRVKHERLHPEYEKMLENFQIEELANSCTKPEVVTEFVQLMKYGMLPRNTTFSITYEEHLEQAVALSKLLYYVKDYDTFYKTAVWARLNINQGMFIYALTVALVHRQDTRTIMLPPIYEVSPHYFFDSTTMAQAKRLKQQYNQVSNDKTYHTIESNYSGWYLNLHREQSLSYFMEDVGVNSFYYYYKIYYPSWMSSEEFGWKDSRRGEIVYYIIQQILARYYAERISNGLGEIPFFDWDTPVETPFEPSLSYPNGLPFPSRPKFANLHEYFYNYGQKWTNNIYGYSHNIVNDFERRINDAIDMGVIFSEDGKMFHLNTEERLNMLGNLIQSNRDSVNDKYYGDLLLFARHLLGYSRQPLDSTKLVPSALEHFETSMRDPIFYQLLKKLFFKFERFMYDHVKPYTEKDLVVPGVQITKMKIDSLITYFDEFDTDLSNGVYYGKEETPSFRIRARQLRLNHKPFDVKMYVKSDKDQKVIMKLYMAPKYDEWDRELNLTENRRNMIEMNTWIQELKSGENEIIKTNNDFHWYVDDRKSMVMLYKEVTDAIEHNKPLSIDGRQNYFYYPRRLMLPMGSRKGTIFRFALVIYHCEQTELPEIDKEFFVAPGSSEIFVDHKPLFYPFERLIKFERMWERIPNIFFHDERIFHKSKQEINAPHH